MKNNFSSNYFKNSEEGCGLAILALLGLLALMFLGPLLVMVLWNWVMVSVLALPAITYWHAFGLMWLCRLLFGGSSIRAKGDN